MFNFIRSKTKRRSLSNELTLGLIVTIVVVSTITLYVGYLTSSQRAKAELEKKSNEYVSSLKDVLVISLWNLDKDAVNNIGKSFIQSEFIAKLKITDSWGEVYFDIKKEDAGPSVTKTIDLFREDYPVGQVEISLTSSYFKKINQQLFLAYGITVIISIMSLIIMTGILLRLLLKKPLFHFSEFVRSYASGNYNSFNNRLPYDELQPFVRILREMGDKITYQMTELHIAEKKFRSIFENAVEGIFQTTPDDKIISANPALAQILGYSSQESLMSKVTNVGLQLYFNPDRRKAFRRLIEQKKLISFFEAELLRADGTIIWASINARPVFDESGKIHHYEGSLQDITKRKRAEQKLLKSERQLRSLAMRLTEVEEASRKKLAQELHDLVGQNLTALNLNLNIIQSRLSVETKGTVAKRLTDSMSLIEDTTEHIRDVMADLRPPVLDDYGLIAALRWYSEKYSERTGTIVELFGAEITPRPSQELETVLYRITQEALTNVAKHADANRVVVDLKAINGRVRLSIADDGNGFDVSKLDDRQRHGWGLITIQERAQAMGGNVRIESQPGTGTRVVVKIKRKNRKIYEH